MEKTSTVHVTDNRVQSKIYEEYMKNPYKIKHMCMSVCVRERGRRKEKKMRKEGREGGREGGKKKEKKEDNLFFNGGGGQMSKSRFKS